MRQIAFAMAGIIVVSYIPFGLAAGRFPASSRLVANVRVQVSREAQDVAVHVIRNDVGEQAPHVRQYARVLDQCRKKVVLETGGGGLDPFEIAGRSEQLGGELAEEPSA